MTCKTQISRRPRESVVRIDMTLIALHAAVAQLRQHCQPELDALSLR